MQEQVNKLEAALADLKATAVAEGNTAVVGLVDAIQPAHDAAKASPTGSNVGDVLTAFGQLLKAEEVASEDLRAKGREALKALAQLLDATT